MGKMARVPEVRAGVADLLCENGDRVRKPAAKVCRDTEGRDVLCWIDRTSLKAAGLVWRKDTATEHPS